MAKLSDAQLIVLSAAAARDDGNAVIPDGMKAAAATKVGSSLINRKLMREVKAKPGVPVWYEDGKGRGYSLTITTAGRKAIGVEDKGPADATTKPGNAKNAGSSTRVGAANGKARKGRKVADAETATATASALPADVNSPATTPRAGSKQALVVKMLSAKNGVTLPALEDATGWLPHTTRAALTGLRKKGFAITRTREPGKNAIYRIGEQAPAAAA